MGWYPGIIGNSESSGVDLVALCASSVFDLDDTITSSTIIPKYMFNNQPVIRNINLSNIEIVDDEAFSDCGSGTYVSINLPKCKSIGKNSFSGFNSRMSDNVLNLPECTTLSQRAFGNSTAAKGLGFGVVNLPKIEFIDDYCFQRGNFGTINIGSSCSSLGVTPFLSTTTSTLYCEASVPPVTNRTNLGFESIGVIYVPQGSVSAYQIATGWSAYASKIEAIPV